MPDADDDDAAEDENESQGTSDIPSGDVPSTDQPSEDIDESQDSDFELRYEREKFSVSDTATATPESGSEDDTPTFGFLTGPIAHAIVEGGLTLSATLLGAYVGLNLDVASDDSLGLTDTFWITFGVFSALFIVFVALRAYTETYLRKEYDES